MKKSVIYKRSLVALWFTIISMVLLIFNVANTTQVNAAPALNDWKEFTQPSGETFQARMEGDEFSSWFITNTEEVIMKDREGYWSYVKVNDNQNLTTTDQKVGISTPPINPVLHNEWANIVSNQREMSEAIALSPFLTSPAQTIIPSPNFGNDLNSPSFTMSSINSLSTGTEPNVPDAISPYPALVLLVSFSDVNIRYSETQWSNTMFGTTGKTVRTYYEENSNGKGFYFSPANESFGTQNDGVVRVTLNRPHPNPGGNTDSRNQQVVRDALIAADSYVDFSSFDTNGNGHLEFGELHIVTITAGYEASSGSSIPSVWGHRWSLWSGSVAAPILDAVSISQYPYGGYTQQGEVQTTNGEHMATIGILAHELGHDIGLKDVYDISYRTEGVGIHSLMAGGGWGRAFGDSYSGQTPTHIDPYQKMLLGFVTPIEASDGFYTLNQSASTGSYNVLKVPTTRAGEYFLIENRQLAGFDAGLVRGGWLREGGIAIWHIDNNIMNYVLGNGRTAWEWNSQNDTSVVPHPGIKLIEANKGLLGYSQLDTKRLYDGPYWDHYFGNINNDFNDTSNPNSKLWSGVSSGIEINIAGPIGSQMEVRIGNPEKQLNFSSATYLINENDVQAEITVERRGNSTGVITVNYATSDGTAIDGVDYTATSGTLEFLDGEMSKTFNIPIIDNNDIDGDKTVNIQLTDPGNGATLGSPSQAELTIDDDEIAPTVEFSAPSYQVNENNSIATITLKRTGNTNMTSNVNYTLSNGTAQAGVDYQTATGTVTFNPGETEASFDVAIIDNQQYDGDRTVRLGIQNPVNASLGVASGVLTIVNDEISLLRFQQSSYSVVGGNSINIIVERVGDSSSAASVSYATTAGTAIDGTHYQASSGTLNFLAGETSKTITITTLANEGVTETRTVELLLSNPSVGSAIDGTGERKTTTLSITYSSGGTGGTGGGDVDTLRFISANTARVPAGSSVLASIEAKFVDGSIADVTSQAEWTSSHPGVATVENGVITGMGAGTTVVTAVYGGVTTKITVTVR